MYCSKYSKADAQVPKLCIRNVGKMAKRIYADMAELADAGNLKFLVIMACGFKSRYRHHAPGAHRSGVSLQNLY